MIREFFMGAYPYIIIGMILAVIAAVYGTKVVRDREAKKNGNENAEPMPLGEWFRTNGYYVSSVSMYVVGLMEWCGDNNSSSAITFFCLGSAFLCLGATMALNKKTDGNDKA